MSDLIRREDAINEFWKSEIEFRPSQIDEVLRILNAIPSAEPKVGKWFDHSDEGYVQCPFCGSLTTCEDNIDELHYCFSCGAKMERGER